VIRLKVVLIDDEQNALDYLADLLSIHDDIEIIGTYLNPILGMENILQEDVDLVFLDINMPNFLGIDVAAEIKKIHPDIFIVFVTAYEAYALDAFRVDAVDYLMKPVIEEQLDETMTRIRRLIGNELQESKLNITLLQRVQFILPGNKPTLIHFKMTKVQHLFIYLLHNRSRIVRKEYLLEMLWGDLEEKNAFSQLYNAIYIMRKELEPYKKYVEITTFSDSYRLDLTNTIVDVDEFEFAIPTLPIIDEHTYATHQQIVDIYAGNFLTEYDYLWVENERYRLQTLWVNIALDLLDWYYENEKYDAAMKLCVTISELAPLAEDAYFYLMKINDKKGTPSAVHYHYSQLKDVLYRDIQEHPKQDIIDWYEQWKQQKKVTYR